MTPSDDSTIMESLAMGDRRAFRLFYERYAEFIYRIAYRFLGNPEDARDITQSVFVTIVQSAHRYRPEAKLSTWIYRIVINRCLNYRSKVDRRLRVSATERELEDIPAPEEKRPDRLMDRAEQRASLSAAIQALPERGRMAVILCCYEGKSYKEIADLLGCSKKSVESLLVRARRSLAEYFSK